MIVQRDLGIVRIFNRAVALSGRRTGAQIPPSLLLLALLFAAGAQDLAAYQDAPAPAQSAQGREYLQQTPDQLQQLVAPVALYPDSLVAQILGASTFPEQVIEPASPEIVYVPAYDPWVVYGDPIVAWAGWYPYPEIWYAGPYLSFGVGFGIGYYGGYEWGWHHWGSDWHHRSVIYNHDRYYSGSRTFYNRNTYYRGEPGR